MKSAKSRFLSMLTATMTLIGTAALLPAMQSAAEEETATNLYLETQTLTTEEAKEGWIPVSLCIEGNPGFSSIGLRLDFDSALTVATKGEDGDDLEVTQGAVAEGMQCATSFTAGENACSAVLASTELHSDDGVMLTFFFAAPEDATPGDCYDIELSVLKFSDNNATSLPFTSQNGGIQMIEDYSNQTGTVQDGLAYAFYDNEAVVIGSDETRTTFSIPDEVEGRTVTRIGDAAFDCRTKLKSITLPNSLVSIGNWAFEGCEALKAITLPDGMYRIGNGAFYNCQSLAMIKIPESVTDLGTEAFRECYSLKKVTLSSKLTEIPNNSFSCCAALTSVSIPEGITYIGVGAFYSCMELSAVTLPESLKVVGDWAFYNCVQLTELTIPANVFHIGVGAFEWCCNITTLSLGEKVQYIDNEAFSRCTNLTNLVLPEAVSYIGKYAFYDCMDLTEITIPAGAKRVGEAAFFGCTALKKATVLGKSTAIDEAALGYCFDDAYCYALIPEVVMYGYAGSVAQEYAFENEITFEKLDAPTQEMGDISGDGNINSNDAVLVLRAYSATMLNDPTGLTADQEAAADVNKDDKIDSADAVMILRFYAASLAGDTPSWDAL